MTCSTLGMSSPLAATSDASNTALSLAEKYTVTYYNILDLHFFLYGNLEFYVAYQWIFPSFSVSVSDAYQHGVGEGLSLGV